MWFHRYKDGKDIEGRCEFRLVLIFFCVTMLICFTVDYNSWIESDKALRLAKSLPKDTVIVEGQNIRQMESN